MATRSISAYLLRSTTTRRLLSTESAAAISAESEAPISTESSAAISIQNQEAAPSSSRAMAKLIFKAKKEGNVIDALNKAIAKGIPIRKWNIVRPINQYRRVHKYKKALELAEWLESNKFSINNADRAVMIELLAKAKNLDSAEEYFNTLPESEKTTSTYGALLNSYCMQRNTEKASELFEKLKEVNATSTLNYNNMIHLYLQIGQPENVRELVQEMEQNEIALDLYTYNMLINSYGKLKDVDAAEEVFEKMKDCSIQIDSLTYGNLATIYVNAGLLDKANSVLEKMEGMGNSIDAFHTLITLHAQIPNLLGIYRVWESLKESFRKPPNTSYLMLLMALSKLGDFKNLEKYFHEWESECEHYDVRLSNVLLESYLKRDMIEEAELQYNSVLKKGVQPNLRTLELLTSFYIKNSQFDLALQYLEMGASKAAKSDKKWVLPNETVERFLKYFEENGDSDTTKKFCDSMKMVSCPDSTLRDSCLSLTS